MSLLESFWADSTPFVRRRLLDEAAGRNSGAVEFQFDTFDVVLDFETGTATVVDVLAAADGETTDLNEFLQVAESFADDLAIGDGLTEMQRHPPTIHVDSSGSAERTEMSDQPVSEVVERELRQLTLMLDRLNCFRAGDLALGPIVNDLEALLNELGLAEDDWREQFVEAWSALEIAYAVALDRLQEIPTIRDPDVADGVKELDGLVRDLIRTLEADPPT